jgi:hypothetical protein
MLENEDLNVSEYEFLGQWHDKKNEILSENSSWVCKRMRPIRKSVNIKVVAPQTSITLMKQKPPEQSWQSGYWKLPRKQ